MMLFYLLYFLFDILWANLILILLVMIALLNISIHYSDPNVRSLKRIKYPKSNQPQSTDWRCNLKTHVLQEENHNCCCYLCRYRCNCWNCSRFILPLQAQLDSPSNYRLSNQWWSYNPLINEVYLHWKQYDWRLCKSNIYHNVRWIKWKLSSTQNSAGIRARS